MAATTITDAEVSLHGTAVGCCRERRTDLPCWGVTLILWSRFADRSAAPRLHLVATFVLACAGFILAASTTVLLAEIGLAMAAAGILSSMPIFWGSIKAHGVEERAVVVAATNAIGNVGGLPGPYIVGLLVGHTHHFGLALVATAGAMLAGSLLCFLNAGKADGDLLRDAQETGSGS
jgi:ACS family tartrate transporter-like MFS transporter